MTKLILLILISIFFTSCAKNYDKSKNILPTYINFANECKNDTNKSFETDCYDLIAYKNPIALLRLGVLNYKKGKFKEALKQLTIAQQQGNFYANSIISDILKQSIKTPKDEKKVIDLLLDVEKVDPIASYKLYFYYKSENNNKKALELLNFSANNNVKEAQEELSKLYANGELVKADLTMSLYLLKESKVDNKDFVYDIYGIKNYFK